MELVLILLLNSCIAQSENNNIVFDFSKNSNLKDWKVVNDVVMGGDSNSTIILNNEGNAEFIGIVSTANNGGFASIRYRFDKKDIEGKSTIRIRLKGDSKSYQFRVKSKSSNYYSYITTFSTSNEWETIEIKLNDLIPSFRGYKLDQPNFESSSIEQISFLISNKKNESFKLEIDKIEIK